jgi:hypothetical protein
VGRRPPKRGDEVLLSPTAFEEGILPPPEQPDEKRPMPFESEEEDAEQDQKGDDKMTKAHDLSPAEL